LQETGFVGDNEGSAANFDEPFTPKIGEQSSYGLAGGVLQSLRKGHYSSGLVVAGSMAGSKIQQVRASFSSTDPESPRQRTSR
jgi:hypothetical protein